MIGRRLVVATLWMAAFLAAPGIGVTVAAAGGLTVQTVPGLTILADVWCAPDSTCLGVGTTPARTGAIVVLRPTGVGPVLPVPGSRSLSAITCQRGYCLAVGTGGRGAVVVNVAPDGTPGAVWTVPDATALHDIACATPLTCLATGSRRLPRPPFSDAPTPVAALFVVVHRGVPGPAQGHPEGSPVLAGISCPTETRCLAVGGGGIAVFSGTNRSWTATTSVVSDTNWSGRPAEDVSCPSPTGCYATAIAWVQTPEGHLGVPAIMPLSVDGVAGPIQALSNRSANAFAISCVADGVCTIVGNDNWALQGLVIDVRPASPPAATVVERSNWFGAVHCISASSCGISGAEAGIPQVPVFAWRT
jgi:hypothetical protein